MFIKTEPKKYCGYYILSWPGIRYIRDDLTSLEELMYHYSFNLSTYIQSYTFDVNIADLDRVNFNGLPNEQKMICRFFCYTIFNYIKRLHWIKKTKIDLNVNLFLNGNVLNESENKSIIITILNGTKNVLITIKIQVIKTYWWNCEYGAHPCALRRPVCKLTLT